MQDRNTSMKPLATQGRTIHPGQSRRDQRPAVCCSTDFGRKPTLVRCLMQQSVAVMQSPKLSNPSSKKSDPERWGSNQF